MIRLDLRWWSSFCCHTHWWCWWWMVICIKSHISFAIRGDRTFAVSRGTSFYVYWILSRNGCFPRQILGCIHTGDFLWHLQCAFHLFILLIFQTTGCVLLQFQGTGPPGMSCCSVDLEGGEHWNQRKTTGPARLSSPKGGKLTASRLFESLLARSLCRSLRTQFKNQERRTAESFLIWWILSTFGKDTFSPDLVSTHQGH